MEPPKPIIIVRPQSFLFEASTIFSFTQPLARAPSNGTSAIISMRISGQLNSQSAELANEIVPLDVD